MPRRPTIDERNIGARGPLIALLLEDSGRQLAANAATASAMGTRAAILIASASIVTGLQLARPEHAAWYLIALAWAVIAALLGGIVALPRNGLEVDLHGVEDDGWNETDTVAARRLLHARLDVLRHDKRTLTWRARLLVAGFLALFVALLCAFLQIAGAPAPFDWSL